jgi:hypothetical protein
MVKDYSALVCDRRVINVIATLAATDGFADDLGDRCRGGGDQEAFWQVLGTEAG